MYDQDGNAVSSRWQGLEMGSRVRGHMVASLLKLYLGGGSEVRLHLGKQPVKLAIGRAVGLRGGVGDGDQVW